MILVFPVAVPDLGVKKFFCVHLCKIEWDFFFLVSGAAVSVSCFKSLNKEVHTGSSIFQHDCEFLCCADLISLGWPGAVRQGLPGGFWKYSLKCWM